MMDFALLAELDAVRIEAERLAATFDDDYWRAKDSAHEFPWEFYAGFRACDRAMPTLGGFGYACEYNIERYWRESRLMRIAPISQEMALNYIGGHVLRLPKSY